MRYWLVKTEPESYSWEDMLKEGDAMWDGVRNYQARNFMKEMEPGDRVFYYYSGKSREIVGLAEVAKAHYPDPTADEPDKWVAVDIRAIEKWDRTVTLAEIKADDRLAEMKLLRNSRLSVMPIENEHAKILLQLAGKG